MGTVAYVKAATSVTEYPLVTFARSIGKNTAELTGRDLKKFLKWLWAVEPYRHGKWQPQERGGYFGRKLIVTATVEKRGRMRENGRGKQTAGEGTRLQQQTQKRQRHTTSRNM